MSRRLNSSDFNNVIDLIGAVYALGPGGCGSTCGYTCAEITASLRIVSPGNDMTDQEICDTLRAGANSGVFGVQCQASISQDALRARAAEQQAEALARNGTGEPCDPCIDSRFVSVNGIVNDPTSTNFSVCVDSLTNDGVTVEPLYIVNQQMANQNPANQVYVDHVNSRAQTAVANRARAAGIQWPRPSCNPCADIDNPNVSSFGTTFGSTTPVGCGTVFNAN